MHKAETHADSQQADHRNAFWISYLKRRRRLHTAAHEHYVWLANVIMLPALLTSAVASVLSVTLKDYPDGPWIVAAVATSSTFLIGVQQHLKVEAKAESHRISAHRFDQLVTEAVSRSIITGITVRDVAEWEKELHRIAEANQFVLPARIRRRFAAQSSVDMIGPAPPGERRAGHSQPRAQPTSRERGRQQRPQAALAAAARLQGLAVRERQVRAAATVIPSWHESPSASQCGPVGSMALPQVARQCQLESAQSPRRPASLGGGQQREPFGLKHLPLPPTPVPGRLQTVGELSWRKE